MNEATLSLTFTPVDRCSERKRWTAYYESRLQNQLVWAIQYTQSHKHQPLEIIQHLNSILTLLHQARRYQHLYPLALSLITAFHPWPAKWGYWDIWEAEVHFAIQTATQLGRFDLQAEFQAYLAHMLFQTGKFQQAIDTARKAASTARNHGTIETLISATETSIDALRTLGLSQQADEELRELHKIAVEMAVGENATDVKKAEVTARIAWLQTASSYGKEHTAYALSTIHRSIALLEETTPIETSTLAHAYNLRGVILWRQDAYTQATQDLEKALDLFSQEGDVFSQASIAGNLGIVYWSMGEFIKAEKALRRCIAITEELNAHWRLLKAIRVLAAVYLARGQLHKALRYCERHLELAIELNEPLEIAGAQGNRGTVRLHLNEFDAARHDFEAELAIEGDATHIGVGCSYANLSRCYAALGQRQYALALARKAWDLAELNSSTRLHIVALRCLAEYQRPEESREHLDKALTLAQKHERRFDQAACLLILAGLMDDEAKKVTLWKQGVALLQQMGAIDWLRGHTIENPPYLPLIV